VDTKQFWHPSTKNPANICRHIKGVGLVTVFAHKGMWKFGYGQGVDRIYSEPYPTQHATQLAVAELFKVPSALRVDAEENSTMDETAAAQQRPQYVTRAAYDKLAAYTKQLAAEHNKHEERIEALETAIKALLDVQLSEVDTIQQ
jgi:hypothetical protein